MSSTAPRPSEDGLIARYFAPIAGPGSLGLLDDAALVAPTPGHELVITADAVVAGVHFFPNDPPSAIGRKALGVNLSDLAAKGAEPLGFLLTLALPEDWTEAFLKAFCDGLAEASRGFACPLLGGDTVRSPGPLTVAITALGQVPAGAMVRRGGARAGDCLCVTGTVGDAALGLALRQRPAAAWTRPLSLPDRVHLTDRYLHPRPRLPAATALRRYASAAMDVSDGFAGDLAKMLRVAGLTGEVDLARLPLSPAARAVVGADARLLDRVLTGGDDYEILCTVAPESVPDFLQACAEAGVAAAAIGQVLPGEGPPVFRDGAETRRYERGSYSHF